jgi:hypothetical protein
MSTHLGKIGRLPRVLRDELNQRLDNGEKGEALLRWLNRQPATLKVMQDHFGGSEVTKQNLSVWRDGGFLDWQRQQESLAIAGRLLEDASDLKRLATDGPLADRFSELLAVSLGHLLREAMQLPAGPEKTRAVLGAAEELIRLRQTDRELERAKREETEWQRKQRDLAATDQATAEHERRNKVLEPIHIADRRAFLTTAYGGTEAAERRAWLETAVEFDLPKSEWTPPPKSAPPSAPVAKSVALGSEPPTGAATRPSRNPTPLPRTAPDPVAGVADPGSAPTKVQASPTQSK